MSLCAIIPVANMASANATLQGLGFGEDNFQVPSYVNGVAKYGSLHAWNDTAFSDAVKAIPSVIWEESDGDPVSRTNELIQAQGAKYGAQAPALPTTGNTVTGNLYRYTDGSLLYCITGYNTVTYPNPIAVPSLICRIGEPNVICEWWQPIYAYDAPKLANPFTGLPDKRTHNGKTWVVSQADGAGNNIWEPSVFGWTEVT